MSLIQQAYTQLIRNLPSLIATRPVYFHLAIYYGLDSNLNFIITLNMVHVDISCQTSITFLNISNFKRKYDKIFLLMELRVVWDLTLEKVLV